MHKIFWSENQKGTDVTRRIILELILRKSGRKMRTAFTLSQDRDHWRAVVKMAMTLRVTQKATILLTL
jgi:hypothetical protein